jgi:tRNA G18 (ribose-2'-O)-methylase SpoU
MGQWIKRAVRLANSSQFRQGEERCIIGGHHIVSEYLQKNRKMIMLGVSKEYLRRHPAGPNGIFLNSKSIQSETIGDQNIPFGVLPDRAFKLITREASPEGVIAEVPLPRPKSISNDRVLILFNLSLPSNVGALIRSAVAFGWSILIVERCTDPFSYSAIRCSMGTAVLGATIERAKVDDLCDILLNNKLSTILATINQESLAKSLNAASITDQSWSPSLSSLTCIDGIKMSRIPSGGIALILGNETLGFAGLSNEIIRSAITVTIDTGEVESLNVAVAGGILMHTFRKSKGITNFV